jgi:hypothetical protein
MRDIGDSIGEERQIVVNVMLGFGIRDRGEE